MNPVAFFPLGVGLRIYICNPVWYGWTADRNCRNIALQWPLALSPTPFLPIGPTPYPSWSALPHTWVKAAAGLPTIFPHCSPSSCHGLSPTNTFYITSLPCPGPDQGPLRLIRPYLQWSSCKPVKPVSRATSFSLQCHPSGTQWLFLFLSSSSLVNSSANL